jgi:hypothetical protein
MDDFDGGDRFGSPMMGMFGMLGAIIPILVTVMMISLMAPAILYVIARWRQNREPVQDPQLGIKFALSFFRQLGYQTMLLGGFMVLYGITSKTMSGHRDIIMRPAFGILVPGLIVWGVHNLALQRTNRIQFPGVERLFAGYNLITTGILGFVGLIMVFQSLFGKGESGEGGRIAWSLALVYTSAWATQGVVFLNRVLDTPPPSSMAPPSSGSAGGAGGGDAPWSKPLS